MHHHSIPEAHAIDHAGTARRPRRRQRLLAALVALGAVTSAGVDVAGATGGAGVRPVPTPARPTPVPYPATALPDVAVADGVGVDAEAFVDATALPAQAELAPLFTGEAAAYLSGEPTYQQPVTVLDDRLVVDRELTFELGENACDQSAGRAELAGLCFSIDPAAPVPPEVAETLAEIRDRLATRPGDTTTAAGVDAAQALTLSDAELLDLVLNRGQRSIRRVSTVPLAPVARGTDTTPAAPNAGAHAGPVGPVATDVDGSPSPSGGPVRPGREVWTGTPPTFDTRYFLTGDTIGREISDRWEYTIAEETWWHGRYYVRFDYELAFGFGVRAPFSVDVTHRSGGPGLSTVDVAVSPVDVDEQGAPAYPAVGLDPAKYFDGSEFVLELRAECTFTVSIPGPDPSTRTCDGLPHIDESRDIEPILADEVSEIEDWWIEGNRTGLDFDIGVARASVDLGIGADVRNGRIGMAIEPLANTALPGVPGGLVWFDDRNPWEVTVDRLAGPEDAGFTLSDPQYAFDLTARPKVRLNAGIDLAIYENEWSWTWPLDFLSVGFGVPLDHHPGTVDHHDYRMGFHQEVAVDPAVPAAPTGSRPAPADPRRSPVRTAPGSVMNRHAG